MDASGDRRHLRVASFSRHSARTQVIACALALGVVLLAGTASAGSPPKGRTIDYWVAAVPTSWNIVPNDTNGVTDIFVHDTQTGKTFRASVSGTGADANGYSGNAMISADGHLVVFESDASNLAGRDKNLTTDIYGRTIG